MVSGTCEAEQIKVKVGCGNPDKPQQPDQAETHDWENWKQDLHRPKYERDFTLFVQKIS